MLVDAVLLKTHWAIDPTHGARCLEPGGSLNRRTESTRIAKKWFSIATKASRGLIRGGTHRIAWASLQQEADGCIRLTLERSNIMLEATVCCNDMLINGIARIVQLRLAGRAPESPNAGEDVAESSLLDQSKIYAIKDSRAKHKEEGQELIRPIVTSCRTAVRIDSASCRWQEKCQRFPFLFLQLN